jgi:uncharacterized protein YdeI (BOF family)/predicted peroxiredoxin
MNYRYLLLLSALSISGACFAQSNHNANDYPLRTIDQAVKMADESRVSLDGIFLRQERGEEDEFIFADSKGSDILVYDRQAGRSIRLNTPVRIFGEVDRGFLKTEINLHSTNYEKAPTPASSASLPGTQAALQSTTPPATDANGGPEDGLFIHLSSGPDAPRKVAMAMTMAAAFAADHPVLIYADLDAVELFVQDAKTAAVEGYQPVDEHLARLKAHGVMLRVCPTCLAAAGYATTDLAEGVGLADKREFFSFTDGRILSVDY